MSRSAKDVLSLIAKGQQTLAVLDQKMREPDAQKNVIIRHNFDVAQGSAAYALELLAQGHNAEAYLIAEIAWLRADFANQAFDLEQTEYLLGEADYLELAPNWHKHASESLARMKEAIEHIRHDATGET